MQARKEREALENTKKDESKEEIEISEELIENILELLRTGVREQRIVGILEIEFKTLEQIRNQLIAERKNNKRRN